MAMKRNRAIATHFIAQVVTNQLVTAATVLIQMQGPVAVLLLLMIAMTIRATASPGQSSAPALQTSARAVALHVAVTDKNGMSISGLTKANFTVLEDGQP